MGPCERPGRSSCRGSCWPAAGRAPTRSRSPASTAWSCRPPRPTPPTSSRTSTTRGSCSTTRRSSTVPGVPLERTVSDGPDVAGVPTTAVTLGADTDWYAEDVGGQRVVVRPRRRVARRCRRRRGRAGHAGRAPSGRRLRPRGGARLRPARHRAHGDQRRRAARAGARRPRRAGALHRATSGSSSSRPRPRTSCSPASRRASRQPGSGPRTGLAQTPSGGRTWVCSPEPGAAQPPPTGGCCWAGIHCCVAGSHCQPSWMMGCSAGAACW